MIFDGQAVLSAGCSVPSFHKASKLNCTIPVV
jgi:hypothetical protein